MFFLPFSPCRVWLQGTQTPNVVAYFGTRKVASSSSTPGSRVYSCGAVTDAGQLILHAGFTLYGAGVWNNGFLFTPSTNQWQWQTGSSLSNTAATYVVGKNVPLSGSSSAGGSRFRHQCWWLNGKFYYFGGYTYTGVGKNDMWSYDLASDTFRWIHGSSSTSSAGSANAAVYPATKGVPTSTALPYPRSRAAFATDTAQQRLYMFGGETLGNYNGVLSLWAACDLSVSRHQLMPAVNSVAFGAHSFVVACWISDGTSILH
jgi:hypothetical protein